MFTLEQAILVATVQYLEQNLYYHYTCLPAYINKYYHIKSQNEEKIIIRATKKDIFMMYVNTIQDILDSGSGITLS